MSDDFCTFEGFTPSSCGRSVYNDCTINYESLLHQLISHSSVDGVKMKHHKNIKHKNHVDTTADDFKHRSEDNEPKFTIP